MKRGPTVFALPQPGAVQFNVSLRISIDEIARWKPEQIEALMRGIALVQSAGKAEAA